MTTNSHEVWANSTTPLFLANPAQSITLSPTSGTGNVNLSNINGQLYQNGLPVGDAQLWSTYPATSNTILMDGAGNKITNVGNNLYYNGNLIANASDIQNIGDWSLYNAVSDVNLSNLTSNYSIVGAKNITALSNVSAGTLTSSGAVSGTTGTFTSQVVTPIVISASNLSVSATNNLTQYCGSNLSNNAPTISNSFNSQYTIAGDKGSDYTDFCYTTLSNKGGKGGQINLVADAGSVKIEGVTYGIGGLINITANSPLTLPYNATSAIKLSAASILSYAGAVSPIGSLAGYNYIQGTLGVNIIAGSASSVPNTAGTNYLWGANGTKIQNTLYVDQIVNYPSSNLNIHPDTAADITKVQFIGMGSASNENLAYPVIRGAGNAVLYGFSSVNASTHTGVDYTGTTLNGFTTLTNSIGGDGGGTGDLSLTAYKTTSGIITPTYTYRNINLTSSSNINLNTSNGGQVLINGLPIANSSSNWSSYPALTGINANSNTIINCGGLDLTFGGVGHNIYGVSALTMGSGGTLNMSGGNISNVGNIYGSNTTISTGGNLTLTSSTGGQIVAGVDLNMSNHNINMATGSISNLSTLNGHNLYQVGAWASTSSNTLTANTITPVAFQQQLITPVGSVSYSSSSNYFSVTPTGNYLVSATLEFTASGGGGSIHPLYAWIQGQGNTDIPYSARHIDIQGGSTAELTLSATLNDPIAFRIVCATSSANVSFTYTAAQTSPYSRPAEPSATISIILVS